MKQLSPVPQVTYLGVIYVFALVLDVLIEGQQFVCLNPKLNCPLSLYDQTHKNKCLDNFFVEHKMYPSLKQESRVCILDNQFITFFMVLFPTKTMPLLCWCKLIPLISVCFFLRILPLFYQPNLGKTCPTIFLKCDAFGFLMSLEDIPT